MTTGSRKSTPLLAFAALAVLGALLGSRPVGAQGAASQDARPEPEPYIYFERFTYDSPAGAEAAFEAAHEYCARLRAVSTDHDPVLYTSPIGGAPEVHVLASSPTSLAMRDAYQATIRDEPCMESLTQLATSASTYDDSVWVPIPLEPRRNATRGTTVILRTFRAKGHERYAARAAAVALGDYVNRTFATVDARLYEQNIGELGTYQWLFHVNDYQAWLTLELRMAADERYRELFAALYSRCREGTRTRALFPSG